MNNSHGQNGYQFSDEEQIRIRDTLERTHRSTGITVSYTFAESGGFHAVFLGINDASLGFNGNVVIVQSRSNTSGSVQFAVLSAGDGQLLTPSHIFDTFLEALVYGDVFLRRVIEDLTAKREEKRPASGKSTPAFAGNAIDSRVLSPEEVHYVQTFANDLGRASGLTGFAKFIESSAGVMSIALGVMNKEEPIMLGTVVAVSNETGSSCTVRDFQNRPMRGPEYYESIYAALVTTRSSFEKLAQITAKHLRPSLLSRLFGQ